MAKKIRYAGEVFEGYNKPKKTPGGKKKFAVLVKDGGKNKIRIRKEKEMTWSRISDEDRQIATNIYNEIKIGRISTRQVYDAVQAGQIPSGAAALLADGIDFSTFKADDLMESYKAEAMKIYQGM